MRQLVMINLLVIAALIGISSASTLSAPPQSALVVAFENAYELSLLANTLTDQGIDATMIVASDAGDMYENLVEVEVIKLNVTSRDHDNLEKRALNACEALLGDQKILKRIGEIQPTFTIFPAIRHDACLIPWARFISSNPVVWALGINEEHYAVQKTKMGIPIFTEGIYERFWANVNTQRVIAHVESNFVNPAMKIATKYVSNVDDTLDELYSNVELFLWGGDPILRTDFASLTQRFVEIGCHHCRGVQPLPSELQKELVEFRLGTIVVSLENSYTELIKNMAKRLPQGRQGQAVAWKSKNVRFTGGKPENLFVHSSVDRQDLIGYPRARVFLSHCDDTELLESGFHGTPIICFPRNPHEKRNAQRAAELGFSISLNDDYSLDKVVKTIVEIHESALYRENARSVSLAIRDRPMPASDRTIFWLRYVARNEKSSIEFSPVDRKTPVKTFAEDIQLYIGILLGTICGVLFASTTALTWYYQNRESKSIRSKGRKYNR
ncbi:UDP-glucuronosyltransferase 1-8 [Fopius arisanus]|uniref:UDP-glucuronosyltransferase 1-8 n=1 Tax=Fopius arisanus TaxID=64838 RepID=A0A9R1T5A4_9HYME|nr:PREDICTED: UDP-glucuronosyltransferase 1-8-like [Fopius arisanus]